MSIYFENHRSCDILTNDWTWDKETETLTPCNDGSQLTDWRDCPDVSGYNYDNNNNDDDSNNDNNTEDRGEANCGGEPCTATEKEDSWLDEDAEAEYEDEAAEDEGICYTNDNGALGEPVPC